MTAITFPRAALGIKNWISSFDLAESYELDTTGDGGQLAREIAPTLWKASVSIPSVIESVARGVEAWAATVRTPPQTFYLSDTTKKFAAAYFGVGYAGLNRAGGGSFNGTCTLGTVADDNKTVPLSGLPAAFILGAGDHLAFDYLDTIRAYHTIVQGGTANGSGQVTVEVRPHIRPGWEAGATVNLLSPAAKMLMVPGSFQPSPDGILKSFTFQAMQTLSP